MSTLRMSFVLMIQIGVVMVWGEDLTEVHGSDGTHAAMYSIANITDVVQPNMTADDVALAVRHHNQLRGQEGSSNMIMLTWNVELASMAQLWAEECRWEHGQPDVVYKPYEQVGQNLHTKYGTASAMLNVTRSIDAWYNEKQHYNYEDDSCAQGRVCGHYTQVVWARVMEIGCGFAFCDVLASDDGSFEKNNANYFVCNYGPGQRNGVPYRKGPACSQCDSGVFMCHQGLCVNNCTAAGVECRCEAACMNCANTTSQCMCDCASGWMGVDCSDVCEDLSNQCTGVYVCSDPFWEKKCPALCSLCEKPNVCEPSSSTMKTTTSGDKSCAGVICNNGGVLVETGNSCRCRCVEGYHGRFCDHLIGETEHGVMYYIRGDPLQWDSDIIPGLEPILLDEVNEMCQHDMYSDVCCLPGTMSSLEIMEIVGPGDLHTGLGYPTTDKMEAGSFKTMVYVTYITADTSCTQSQWTARNYRLKQRTNTIENVIPQGMLLEAVNNTLGDASVLFADHGMEILYVEAAEVEETHPGGAGGLETWAVGVIAGVSAAVVISLVVGLTVATRKHRKPLVSDEKINKSNSDNIVAEKPGMIVVTHK